MPILRAMDGKFYNVPDDKAASYEVPREKVKELLEKSGAPMPKGGGPGPGPGPGGMHGTPIVFQFFTGGGGPRHGGSPGGAPQGEEAEVNPYWWWENWHNGGWWRNVWNNW